MVGRRGSRGKLVARRVQPCAAPRKESFMRRHVEKHLLWTLLSVGPLACAAHHDPQWECYRDQVPNGDRVECTATSSSALTGTYSCPLNGDINPDCPPPGS